MDKRGGVGIVVLVIVVIVLIVVGGILIWGFTTNWGKSFDAEEVSRYCYTTCVNEDRIKYCTPNLIVDFGDTKMKNTNCKDLEYSKIVGPCLEIECP